MQGLYEEEAKPNYGILGWRHVCPFNPLLIALGSIARQWCLGCRYAHCCIVHVEESVFAVCSRDQCLYCKLFRWAVCINNCSTNLYRLDMCTVVCAQRVHCREGH